MSFKNIYNIDDQLVNYQAIGKRVKRKPQELGTHERFLSCFGKSVWLL
jgi:hypothetical protein